MRTIDIWNTGTAAKGKARRHWKDATGPDAVRAHLSLYNLDGSPRGSVNDNLMGTGMPARNRLPRAKQAGKLVVGCYEWRNDCNDDDGKVLPVAEFGTRALVESPEATAERILFRANADGVDVIQAGNEVFDAWPAQPTLVEYEEVVSILLADGRWPIIADYHPDMAPSIASALACIDLHFFPKSDEDDDALKDRIEREAGLVRAQGGTPASLESILGRGISLWSERGERRFSMMMETFAGNGYAYAPVWWGGYESLGNQGDWTAPGWGNYKGLFLYGPSGKPSQSAKWLRDWQTGEDPPVDPPSDPPPGDVDYEALIDQAGAFSDLMDYAVFGIECERGGVPGTPPPTDPPPTTDPLNYEARIAALGQRFSCAVGYRKAFGSLVAEWYISEGNKSGDNPPRFDSVEKALRFLEAL